MRAVCTICTDNFEIDEQNPIGATACGHVFHTNCLMKWLTNSSTCPQCRSRINWKQIISKLFFDQGDANDDIEDLGKLTNQMNSLHMKLRDKDIQLKQAKESVHQIEQSVSTLEEEKSVIASRLKQERVMNETLRSQLKDMDVCVAESMRAQSEAKKAKEKLYELQTTASVVEGCTADIQDLLTEVGDGPSAVRHLATWLTTLKKEFEKNKSEKQKLREALEISQRDKAAAKRSLSFTKDRQQETSKEAKTIEQILTSVEAERDMLKKQLLRSQKQLAAYRQRLHSSASSTSSLGEKENSLPPVKHNSQDARSEISHSSGTGIKRPRLSGDNGYIDLTECSSTKTSAGANNFLPGAEVISPVLKPVNSTSKTNTGNLDKTVSLLSDDEEEKYDKRHQPRPIDVSTPQLLPTKSSADSSSKTLLKLQQKSSSVRQLCTGSSDQSTKPLSRASSVSGLRKGYDGMGGHSNFVQQSSCFMRRTGTGNGKKSSKNNHRLSQFWKYD